jgi:hypothetical protein
MCGVSACGTNRTVGRNALPSAVFSPARWRFLGSVLALLVLLSGCGAKPKPPTAPIRTHFEDAALLLPPIAATDPWQRLSFNDWERLRARAGLGDVPSSQWTGAQYTNAVANLQTWLALPSTIADADALAPFGLDAATMRWQAGIGGLNSTPMTRVVTGTAKDDRATIVGTASANVGYAPVSPPRATPGAAPTIAFHRADGGASGMLPSLLDRQAAALLVTPTTLLTVHDATRLAHAEAALSADGPSLDSVPLFHGLVVGINEVDACILFRVGAGGYHDATAPVLDLLHQPFDAIGAGLHITDAGAQYVTLAFHLPTLPGGRLPDGMAAWWASRFGLDVPDPRVEYLEAFGNDGWLFARYRVLTADERLGGVVPGEIPFWKSVTTWRTIQQRWSNFAPRTSDPIPQLGR